jgi:membrane-associated phospholipid phosphatase
VFDQGIIRQGWLNATVSVLLAVGVYAGSKVYTALNHGPAVLFLQTPVDVLIPLVKPFVLPYVSLEPLTYVTLLLLLVLRLRIYQSAAVAMLLAFAVSFALYALAQSFVDRPVVTGDDLLSNLVRGVYAGDNPFNAFPSLHTSLSTILAIHWLRVSRWVGTVAVAWAGLIVLSTLFIHQHYVADVAGGLVVALAASWLALRFVGDRLPRPSLRPVPA